MSEKVLDMSRTKSESRPMIESSYVSLSVASEDSERDTQLRLEDSESREGKADRTDSSGGDYEMENVLAFNSVNAVQILINDNVRSCRREVKETMDKMKGRSSVATYEPDIIHINHVSGHVSKKMVVMEYEFQLKEPDLRGPPRLRAVWLNQDFNMAQHKTHRYESRGVHNGISVQQLVVRRGTPFYIELSFDRPFDLTRHSLTIILQFGQVNVCSSLSMICLRVNDGLKPNSWSAGIPSVPVNLQKLTRIGKRAALTASNILNQNKIQVQVNTPTNAVVGKCMMTFDTAFLTLAQRQELLRKVVQRRQLAEKKNDLSTIFDPMPDIELDPLEKEDLTVMRHFHTEPIYMLCNPWKKEDQTYMENERELREYLVSEKGYIYIGTRAQPKILRWNFSQNNNLSLETAIYLMDSSYLSHDTRHDTANIVRTICNNITTLDSSGVVTGNWAGLYPQGYGPAQWLGSLPILQQFSTNKLPVKYGQCYVFAAVATTLCRSLGIPCRCVTNYSSAHDCDGTGKINLHWGDRGEPIDELNPVNFWCFHVWCEAYMKRLDLVLNAYSGWQAFDPTPQETYYGITCSGPCPVEAIRLGDLNTLYDTRLFFSEIYAHHFHWILQQNAQWRVIVQQNKAGTKILTHDPNPKEVSEKDTCFHDYLDKKIEAMDILENYKFKEGTVLEQQTMERADTKAVGGDVFDKGEGDVKFAICQGDCMAGKLISVLLAMQNLGIEERTVKITLTLYSCYYTGLSKHKIKAESYEVTLTSLQKSKVIIGVVPDNYCWFMTDYYTFKIYARAMVLETDQTFCTCEDFCLEFPSIEFEVQSPAITETKNVVRLKWSNPMPIDLMNCSWTVEGTGLVHFKSLPCKNMEPLSTASTEIAILPEFPGKLTLLASFYSHQTGCIRGHHVIDVSDKDVNVETPPQVD